MADMTPQEQPHQHKLQPKQHQYRNYQLQELRKLERGQWVGQLLIATALLGLAQQAAHLGHGHKAISLKRSLMPCWIPAQE
jgi:hypothetical protein